MLQNQRRPTSLLQIDMQTLAVGTENGKVELWDLKKMKLKDIMDAHAETQLGISQLVLLQNANPLLV